MAGKCSFSAARYGDRALPRERKTLPALPSVRRKWLIEHPKLVRFLTKKTHFFTVKVCHEKVVCRR